MANRNTAAQADKDATGQAAEDNKTSTPLVEWEDFSGDYQNYGSVDMNLTPEWSREAQDPTLIASAMVGHVNGKADLFRRDEPGARHQIAWCERGNKIGEAMLRQQGYALVTDGPWVKNPLLWEWEADERVPSVRYCINYNDRAWARPEARYLADRERRASTTPVSQIVGAEQARHPGAAVTTDQQGRMLIATTR